jgi:hypothetical protein
MASITPYLDRLPFLYRLYGEVRYRPLFFTG